MAYIPKNLNRVIWKYVKSSNVVHNISSLQDVIYQYSGTRISDRNAITILVSAFAEAIQHNVIDHHLIKDLFNFYILNDQLAVIYPSNNDTLDERVFNGLISCMRNSKICDVDNLIIDIQDND